MTTRTVTPSNDQLSGVAADMPVSYRIGSDQYAAEIVSVSKVGPRMRIVARLKDDEEPRTFTRRDYGVFIQKGHKHGHLVFGESKTDLDPGF